MNKLFTSESVTEGHPDKLCDRISDAILDAFIKQDPDSRVACECLATTGMVVVSGEISSGASVDIPRTVRETICEVGYDNPTAGFDGNTCAVLTSIDEQSMDIRAGVVASFEAANGSTDHRDQVGAGDQGMMFGYACDETPEMMPLPTVIAHRLAYQLAQARKEKAIPFILPDGKTQVTVEYSPSGEPLRIDTIVLSTQHLRGVKDEELWEHLKIHVLDIVLRSYREDLYEDVKLFINPTGRFVKGGPAADTGLTGRKIIVDTYGGWGRHGGGAFSGKDPTKVDRSGAYMARYIAKNVVAAGLAQRCEVQLAYAIGVANPVSVRVDTFGTGADDMLSRLVMECFDMRPSAIIEKLELRRPIYKYTSAYGHFGNVLPVGGRMWERTDMAEELREAAGRYRR